MKRPPSDQPSVLQRHGAPLYIQIASLLRKRLEDGEWRLDDQIPTLEALMAEYRVARITMRQALARLEEEGLIDRRPGRGTFVTGDATKDRWLIIPTEWSSLIQHIDKLDARIDELEHGYRTPDLRPDEGQPMARYWYARRLNFTAGVVYGLADVYLASEVYEAHPDEYSSRPILPLLARYARRNIGEVVQVLTITTADISTARHLRIGVGAPVAEVRRIVRDPGGRVVYLGEIRYSTRHLRLETVLYSAKAADSKQADTRRPKRTDRRARPLSTTKPVFT